MTNIETDAAASPPATSRSDIITGSRWKTALSLAGCTAFVLLVTLTPEDGHAPKSLKLWAAAAFFGLGAAVFLWLLVRPQVLRLDAVGFTLAGGFIRSPKTIRWTDVRPFFVYKLPKGGKMVGFDYEPSARKDSALIRFNKRYGAEGALPKGWSLDPERLAATLNDYRARALAESGRGTP